MAATDLIIKILSKFSGKGFQEGSDEAKKFKKEIADLGKTIGTAAVVLGLTKQVADFAIEAGLAADEGRAVDRTFVNLSGSAAAATANMEAVTAATRNLISETAQQRIANQLLGLQLADNAGQLEEIISGSRRLGKEFRGLGAADAANEFALLMTNMSVRRLDTFGLSAAKVEQRIDQLMETTQGMTREQAFTQATLEEMRRTLDRLGPEIKTTADRVSEFDARTEDLKAAIGGFGDMAVENFGVMDAVLETGIVALERFIVKIDEADGKFTNLAGRFREAVTEGEGFRDIMFQIVAGADIFGRALGGPIGFLTSSIAEAVGRTAGEMEKVNEAANEAANEQAIIEEETDTELLEMKREFSRNVLDIQRDRDRDLADEAERFADELEDSEEDHQERIADIRKQAAGQLIKIQRDFEKDLAKEDKELKKDLAKFDQDEVKRVTEFEKKQATEEKRQRKIATIDALADERLFQFELRQLAAEGEGNAIKAALERRAIEEEISKEKAQVEQQIEDEKRQETVAAIREEGQERRQQMILDSQERKALIEERNAEEIADLNERIAEQEATENESFAKRQTELEKYHDDRIANIHEGEQEAIAELAQGLTEVEDMTQERLQGLSAVAREFGEDVGTEFARGITEGFERNKEIENLIGGAARGGIQPVSQSQREAIEQLSGGAAMFQNEGVVKGRFGIAHQGEVVLNPNNQGSLGGGVIQIGGQEFITSHAAQLAAAINGQRQRDLQALVNQLAALMD